MFSAFFIQNNEYLNVDHNFLKADRFFSNGAQRVAAMSRCGVLALKLANTNQTLPYPNIFQVGTCSAMDYSRCYSLCFSRDWCLFCRNFDCQFHVFVHKGFISPTSLVGNVPIKSVKRESCSKSAIFMIGKKIYILGYFTYC